MLRLPFVATMYGAIISSGSAAIVGQRVALVSPTCTSTSEPAQGSSQNTNPVLVEEVKADHGVSDGQSSGQQSATVSNAPAHAHVITIGDVHGKLDKLTALWEVLEKRIGQESKENILAQATIVFLGDYVDKGPDSKGVLDWLIQLKDSRAEKGYGPVRFITGNHDFGMGAFIGALPAANAQGALMTEEEMKKEKYLFSDGKPSVYVAPQHVQTALWKADGYKEVMHSYGRLWGDLGRYNSDKTFKSYGIDALKLKRSSPLEMRSELMEKVPETHKQFLRDMEWVVDLEVPWGPGRLVCVHAGLTTDKPEEQIAELKKRNINAEILFEVDINHWTGKQSLSLGRFATFSGRDDVLPVPTELRGKAVVASGHHGFNLIDMASGQHGSQYHGRAVIDHIMYQDVAQAMLFSGSESKEKYSMRLFGSDGSDTMISESTLYHG